MGFLARAYDSRFHFAIRLIKEACQDQFRSYWGINSLDRRLAQLMPYRHGFFVELGANDGRSQSNSLHFERHKNWKGVLIEPCPTAYMRCLMTRSNRTKVFCGCCVEPDKQGSLVPMEYFNLMSVQTDGASDYGMQDHLRELRSNAGGEPDLAYKFGSYGYTLTALLEQAEAPSSIDFLSLDVEGAERSVLRGLDFNKYQFRFILVETRQQQAVASDLSAHGYRLKEQLAAADLLFERDPTSH